MGLGTRLVPPGAREEYVPANGGSFRLLRGAVDGPDTPSLMVHGGGSDNAAISWYRLIGPLSTDRPVIASDLPDFGYTTDIVASTTTDGMADQPRDLIRELGIDRVVVCGVSMGGEVVLQFANRHPRACTALVAIAPAVCSKQYKNPFAHRLAWLFSLMPDMFLRPLSMLANRFVKTVLTRMVADPSTLPAVVVEEFGREARRPGSGHVYGQYNKPAIGSRRMRNNMLPTIAKISTPTLFSHGADDPLVDPGGSGEAVRRMPNARLDLVPNSGHWAHLEAHVRFLAELRSFLRDTAA